MISRETDRRIIDNIHYLKNIHLDLHSGYKTFSSYTEFDVENPTISIIIFKNPSAKISVIFSNNNF